MFHLKKKESNKEDHLVILLTLLMFNEFYLIRSSKNNPTMPTVSHIEVIEEINHCDSRKRIKSESYEE